MLPYGRRKAGRGEGGGGKRDGLNVWQHLHVAAVVGWRSRQTGLSFDRLLAASS